VDLDLSCGRSVCLTRRGTFDSWYIEIVRIGFERIAMTNQESKSEIQRSTLLHGIRNFI
jgi:hypothetical protein